MTDEELIGKTVPTETVADAGSKGQSGSDIASCPNYATPINSPCCATRHQSQSSTAFKFLFLVLMYFILATLGLAAGFSVDVFTQ
jgi:hypothetical protein